MRTAFQCLQLVVTDYLPVLPCGCIPHAIDTVAKFARQKQELNVALSAIGLMVRLSFMVSCIFNCRSSWY